MSVQDRQDHRDHQNRQDRQGVARGRILLRIVLGVSLALNLAVIGLAVGAGLRMAGGSEARRPPPSVGAALYRAMPREDRQALRARMQTGGRAERDAQRQRDVAEARAILATEPFDPAALDALLKAEDRERQQWMDAAQAAWLARVEGMSAEERAAYVERLDRVMDGRDNRRTGWFGRGH